MSDEVISLGDLSPDPNNARKHNPRNVGVIADTLSSVGFSRSIVIDEDGVILAGNATVEAAGEVGMTKVRVIDVTGDEVVAVRRTGLSPAQKLRLALADNRASDLSSWDEAMLATFASAEPPVLNGLFTDAEIEGLVALATYDPDNYASMVNASKKLLNSNHEKYIRWGNKKINLTDEEIELLEAAVDAFVEKTGSDWGFIRSLLVTGNPACS